MAKIRAGQLRHKITIQQRVSTLDSTNAVVYVWSNYSEIRASINPIKGDEYFISATIKSEVDYYIMLRKTDLTTKNRIVFKGEIFDVKYILNENERSTQLLVFAKKRTDELLVFERSDLLLEDGFSLLTEDGNHLINAGV